MKEADQQEGSSIRKSRSIADKERTKMRERQRRHITTNIFNGLRKHGGYRLSPRADINEVLRHLAREAGWVVDPDGTTYRSPSNSTTPNACPLCGGTSAGGTSGATATQTPTSSYVIGECSGPASNKAFTGGSSAASSQQDDDSTLLAVYMMSTAAGAQNSQDTGRWACATNRSSPSSRREDASGGKGLHHASTALGPES